MRGAFAISAAVLLAASSAFAAENGGAAGDEETLVPYTVQRGDTCSTVAARALGDPKRTDIVHKYNPQLGPAPHHLLEGSTLMLPPPTPDAHLTGVRNEVELESKSGTVNAPVYRGNHVRTGDDSSAEMSFRDGSDLSMGERTLVIVLGATRTAADRSDATLVTGALRAHLAELAGKPREPLVVSTPAGAVRVGAGESKIGVDEAKATRLAVYKGRSSIRASGATVKVDGGFGSKAEDGKPPTPPRPLPAAPTWKSAPPPLAVTATGEAEVTGEYARGAGGPDPARWHVQFAHDADFEQIVFDRTTALDVVRFDAKGVVPGSYFARVSAIDGDAFEGPWGAVAPLRVAKVEVTELPNHFSTIVMPGAELACGVDGAAPAHDAIRIDRLVPHALQCTQDGGSLDGSLDLPAADIGPLRLEPKWIELHAPEGHGEAVLVLRDAHGEPVSRPEARIESADPTTVLVSVLPAYDVGRYFVETRWAPGTMAAKYRLVLGSTAIDALPLPIFVPSPPPPPKVTAFEARIGGGVAYVNQGATSVDPRGEVRLGFHAPTAKLLEVAVNLGLSYEHQSPSKGSTASDLALELPITVRLGKETALVRPYVAGTPSLVFQYPSPKQIGDIPILFALTGSVGVELLVGPGAVFLEYGYRGSWAATNKSFAIPIDAHLGTAGYTFRF